MNKLSITIFGWVRLCKNNLLCARLKSHKEDMEKYASGGCSGIVTIWDSVWRNVPNFEEHIDIDNSRDLWTIYHKPFIDSELRTMEKGSVFLEAGCGLGQWCFYASRLRIMSIGIDIAIETVKKLNTYTHDKAIENILFIQDDLRIPSKTTIDKCKCDFFVCLGVIEHFKEPISILKNLIILTKKNGKGLITVPNIYSFHTIMRPIAQILGMWTIGYESSYSPNALKTMAEASGFTVISYGVIPTGELFGSTLNNIPLLNKLLIKLSYFIERKQNTIGFISYVKVKR